MTEDREDALMGQGTMTLKAAAEVADLTVEALAREARDGRLKLHPLPGCPGCSAGYDEACEPTCEHAGSQIVWLGDFIAWKRAVR